MKISNPKKSRWIAIGLLIAVIGAIGGAIIYPLVSMGLEYREKRQDAIFNVRRYKKILSKKEALHHNFEQLKTEYSQQHYFYTRNTIALASADLQAFISQVISNSGGQVIRKNSSAKKLEDNFTRITIDVTMNLTIEALRSIFYEIETVTPLIIIDQVRIKTAPKKRNAKTRKLESNGQLTVNFKASSFVGTP
ncbi:MAG: general secretion pathway protein GspM [Methylococcales bacterium]|nr:general secretion pathway protein GspM [Methylococcales bacterium]